MPTRNGRWDSEPFGSGFQSFAYGTGYFTSFDLRFPGQVSDHRAGRYYNYLRDYDPFTGRYLQTDPIGLDGGVATYTYADSDPVHFFDTFGLCAMSPTNKRCLERIFGESIDNVRVKRKKVPIPNITTRKNQIRLSLQWTCEKFQEYPMLLLHEYYHVLRQWNRDGMNRRGYVWEYLKNGSKGWNKFEDDANVFAKDNYWKFVDCTKETPCIEPASQ